MIIKKTSTLNKVLILFFIVHVTSISWTQIRIKMQEENGIFTIPCTVNGLNLRFIFDTGASDVSISLTEALFMLKNGYMTENDIIGTSNYSIANGAIEEGTNIIIREIKIDGLTLNNIHASIVHSLDAPLLLGQSALSQLGVLQIDGNELTIGDVKNYKSSENEIVESKDSTISEAIFTINSNDSDYNAFRETKALALQGDKDAQLRLGICYDNGEIIGKDKVKAVYWYRKAAEQGDNDAQRNLGVCYEKGEGVVKDDKQAVYWYRKAAEQGNTNAQFNLGICYDNGRGIVKDAKQAVYWYRKAAEQGDNDAQFNLGVCYSIGEGVLKDDKQAANWYRKAAEQGNMNAQYNLGLIFYYGDGVQQDFKKSAYWIKKAFENGMDKASDFWIKYELWKYIN